MKQRPKITTLVDIDNVLNNFAETVLDFYNRDFGTNVQLEDVKEYSLENALGTTTEKLTKYFNDSKLLNACKPREGAIKYLKLLNDISDVYIVTARDFIQLVDIDDWFAKYYPYIQNQQLIRCRDKHLVQGDIRIDDHYGNLKACKGGRILFNYPYNANIDLSNEMIYRVNNWKECLTVCMTIMGYTPNTIDNYINGGNEFEQFDWNSRVR